MTLGEFIAPIKGSTNKNKVLATLYFFHRHKGEALVRGEELKKALIGARAPNARTMNVRDVLARCGHLVDTPGSDGRRRVWHLTQSGEAYVREILKLSEREATLEEDFSSLEEVIKNVQGAEAKGFLEESLVCLRAGAFRAAVVFLWSGTMRTLHERALDAGSRELSAAVRRHDPSAKVIKKVDDFAYVRDAVALQAFQELGLFDKGQATFLRQALDLRNQCGHPSKYRPREKKVSSFIEDVVGIVFLTP